MKYFIMALVLALSVTAIAQENGKPRVISRSRAVFDNISCADTNTCDLLQVRYVAEDYEILVDGDMHYGTRLFAHYVTDSLNTLENYAFVQFIKGCAFHLQNDGEAVLTMTDNFGERIPFNHRAWVIDSADTDPIYFSTHDSRHFNYKWNDKLGSVDKATEKFFGFERPVRPELYITDRPYTAFKMRSSSKNLSLAFKTCLYRTSDVPIETVSENIDFAKPLYCFYWYSSWVYDHIDNKFTNPRNIAPACTQ